jgi:hypothetical protein
MAIDVAESARPGLRGFAIKRGSNGRPQDWLKGLKYFKETVTAPKTGDEYSTHDQPLQSFLWSDYAASPGQTYDFTIVPLYGDPRSLEERDALPFSIKTEEEFDGHHGVWFNRGAIASHAFETEFHNQALTDAMVNNVSDEGTLRDPEVAWLSRGLAEACLHYINSTKTGEGLRVCAYEFTYQPVLTALKRALDRGVDVQIVYHDTKSDNDPNRKAIKLAQLPKTVSHNGKKIDVLYPRTRTKIPHNKFIVKLDQGKPRQVWSGSTNFTDSGFFGQTNVGHLVSDAGTAQIYLNYWLELSQDPTHGNAVANATKLTRNPPNAPTMPISEFFSPRVADNMLDWYAERISDASQMIMMTIPFNVAPTILSGLEKTNRAMRFVILEDAPTRDVFDAEKANRGRLLFSNGALMNKSFQKIKSQFGGAKVAPIPNSPLDKWFVDEELDRPTNKGHVFFIHSKVLLIDPDVRRSPDLFRLGRLLHELTGRKRREHAADPRRYARGRHLPDRAGPPVPPFLRERRHQRARQGRLDHEPAVARHHRPVDHRELQERRLQKQSAPDVLPSTRNAKWQLGCSRGPRWRSVQG